VLALAAIGACGGGGPDAAGTEPGATTVRGDTIVHFAGAPRHARGGALVEDLTIGLLDGPEEYVFGNVGDASLGPGGAIHVLDRQAQVVRQFDRAGTYVRDFGRPGPGPGEYRSASAMAVAPDGSVLIGERGRTGLIQRFSADGDLLGAWELQRGIEGPIVVTDAGIVHVVLPGVTMSNLRSDDLQSIDGQPNWIEVVRGTAVDFRPATLRTTPDGTLIDTVPAPPLRDLDVYLDAGPGRLYVGLDYMPVAWWAWSPSGYLLTGESDRYAIDLRRSTGTADQPARPWRSGDSIVSIRRDVARVAILDAERAVLQQSLAQLLENLRGQTWHGPTEAPTEKPAYHRVLIGRDGRIWVWLHTESEPVAHDDGRWREVATAFDIFGPDGTYIGPVDGPPGIRPTSMRGDTMIAITLHETGVHQVTRFVVRWRE